MLSNLFQQYYAAVGVILFCIGLSNLFLSRNLVKKIIGLNIADTGIYLFLSSFGYIPGRMSPIITDGILDAGAYTNPIPTFVILTGIVISVAVTAIALALTVNLFEKYRTLNLDEIMRAIAVEVTALEAAPLRQTQQQSATGSEAMMKG